jgi:cytochrome c biogenesis protein ResB
MSIARSVPTTIGSLYLAVVLITLYAGVLAWATLIEKRHGADAARLDVYGAAWFAAIHWAIAVNVACSMLNRLPWKHRQAGFLLTHAGILVLLIGCLLTRYMGVQAQLPVYEGHAEYRAYLESDESRRPQEMKLGFQVYLREFRRKLEPGSGMPSHYSSRVDFLDRSSPPRMLRENVLITLNAPVDFTDHSNGRTYRLFQSGFDEAITPWDPDFERLALADRSRDQVCLSRLSVNYDPGRPWKYVGCLMIVVGIVIIYYLHIFYVPREA